MGTRGVWGFRRNGHTIATYRHFDCYPDNLGYEFFEFLKDNNRHGLLEELFNNIVEIDTSVPPTEEQKKRCKEMNWYSGSVSDRNDNDWYCLLHGLQDPSNWQDVVYSGGEVYVVNDIDFMITDSLFCEYGYIFDIDNQVLEFYVGFQHVPQEDNPYGCKPTPSMSGQLYYPCRLIGKLYMDDMDKVKYIQPANVVGWMKILSVQSKKEM